MKLPGFAASLMQKLPPVQVILFSAFIGSLLASPIIKSRRSSKAEKAKTQNKSNNSVMTIEERKFDEE